MPKLFDVCYHILQGSADEHLRAATYEMLKRYLDWWFLHRSDDTTGLITAVFEETFVPYLGCAGEYAPVDTNVEVYVGCRYTELLANELGQTEDARNLAQRGARLKQSINRYLWNEERGAYFPYDTKLGKAVDRLLASTFFPLRMGIASAEQQKKLLKLLTSDEHFNWNTLPLTSVSKKDDAFVTVKGTYQGNASWSGSVWSLINEMTVRGLCDSNENELAAELAQRTVCAFNHNCAEFLHPFDGSGQGVLQYAWSASQYLSLIVEHLFGVAYDAKQALLTVAPKLTKALKNERLELKELCVTRGVLADIVIDCGHASCAVSSDRIKVRTFDP